MRWRSYVLAAYVSCAFDAGKVTAWTRLVTYVLKVLGETGHWGSPSTARDSRKVFAG